MTSTLRRILMASGLVLIAELAAAQPASMSRGEALVTAHCGMCHAAGRTGTSPHPEAPPFRLLGQRYPIESLEEALAEGLMTGHPEMPEFMFAPRDVGAIIRYLQSVQER
jgi:cytochrome c